MIGRVVGSYRIVEKVGEGGMGAVYRAVDEMLDREVAVKAIRPELTREPEIVERFRSEARILARVSHPAITTIYSFFQDGGELFLAMEFVRGRTLTEVLAGGPISWRKAIPLLAPALEGIEQAHRAGIIHRDLKPDNLMLTDAGPVKVMDFGIARVSGSNHLTRTGLLIGTLRYIAPEQIRGEEVDRRTDVYALGALLYQVLTGRVPFDGPTDFAILKAQLDDPPVTPGTHVPGLPEWLDQAVLRALEKSPDARFQTVEEMRTFLLSHLAAEPPVIEDLAEELPTMVLPPRPATAVSAPTITRATPPPASPATMETDRPRATVPPPPPPPPAPVPAAAGTSYRPIGESGKKSWAIAAAAVLVLVLAGVFAWQRSGSEPAAPPSVQASIPTQTATSLEPAASMPTDAPEETPAEIPAPSQQKEAAYQPPPKPSTPPREAPWTPPVPSPEPAPAQTAEPEPSQEAPAASEAPAEDELPLEELRRLAGELVPASEKLGEVYDEFLETKEDGGAEITDNDEQLQEDIEGLTDAASSFNKRFREGIFARTRDRIRKTDQRFEMIRRGRELGAAIGRVEKLMSTVQPGSEVRQQWQEVRRRWERVAVVVGVR